MKTLISNNSMHTDTGNKLGGITLQHKNFSNADLWNIERRKRTRNSRRFL